jgi:hypothetical protein
VLHGPFVRVLSFRCSHDVQSDTHEVPSRTHGEEQRERDRQSAFELMSETTKQVLHVTQKVKQISSNNIDRNGKHAIRKTTPIAPERPLMIE